MKPSTKEFLALLARVDWPRQLQRAAVLVRELRGDRRQTIEADHAAELERGERLRRSIEHVARQSLGCLAPDSCACALCIVARKQPPPQPQKPPAARARRHHDA